MMPYESLKTLPVTYRHGRVLVALLFSVSLILSGGAASGEVYSFDLSLPVTPDTFNGPLAASVDAAGNVYVADTNNGLIKKYNASGAYVTQWDGSASGNALAFPGGVAAITISGTVYIYAADTDNDRIQIFDSSGSYVNKWGANGTGNGQFQLPYGVAAISIGGSYYIYVADLANDRIQKFDANGGYLDQWGVFGVAPGTFNFPTDVAVDSVGNVYVADTDNDRIQKFDANGNYLSTLGNPADPDFAFFGPGGVEVDSAGNVYVVDTLNNRVQKFTQAEVITVKAGVTNGLITCPASAGYGTSPSCSITPTNDGYYISDLQVGPNVDTLTSVPVTSSYTFDNIAADKAIYAVFTTKPIKLVSGVDPFPFTYQMTLADAYAAASTTDGDTMKIQDLPTPLIGNLTIAKLLTMEGGYDYNAVAFTSRAAGAVSVIDGQIDITTGSLIADRIVIQ